jgi:prephenate dehydrogenase
MKIGIIGLGLIGGSFALAAKKYTVGVRLYGQDHNPDHLAEALSLGIIDQPLEVQDYAAMDVILLAIPVDACLTVTLPLLDQINDNTLLLDAGSTKAAICKLVELHPKRNQFFSDPPYCRNRIFGPFCGFF